MLLIGRLLIIVIYGFDMQFAVAFSAQQPLLQQDVS